jgi:hypothetical protein
MSNRLFFSNDAAAILEALDRSQATIEFKMDGTIVKANENFRQLQDELGDLENKIAASRRFFNNAVAEYNASIPQIPAVLFAGLFGFAPAEMYALEGAEKAEAEQAPKVSFGG